MLKNFKDKRILILGFGREGQDVFRFLRKLFPQKILGIADQDKKTLSHISDGRRKYVIAHLGKDYLRSLKDYDVVINVEK